MLFFLIVFLGKTQIPLCDIISIESISHRKNDCLKGFTINYGKRGNKHSTINKWKLETVHLFNNEVKILETWIQTFQALINGLFFFCLFLSYNKKFKLKNSFFCSPFRTKMPSKESSDVHQSIRWKKGSNENL